MAKNSESFDASDSILLATEIVAAYVSNNSVSADKLPGLLQDIYGAVSGLAAGDPAFAANRKPAVPINKSITKDYIICLEDGAKLKMLKRYLRTHYNLTPEEYRRKWGLPADYPMVSPNYSKRRSQFAKDIGLGTAKVKRKPRKAARKKRAAKAKKR